MQDVAEDGLTLRMPCKACCEDTQNDAIQDMHIFDTLYPLFKLLNECICVMQVSCGIGGCAPIYMSASPRSVACVRHWENTQTIHARIAPNNFKTSFSVL